MPDGMLFAQLSASEKQIVLMSNLIRNLIKRIRN